MALYRCSLLYVPLKMNLEGPTNCLSRCGWTFIYQRYSFILPEG